MASVAIVPTSGNITAKATACKITVSAGATNTLTGYTTAAYPTSPEVRYYLRFEVDGAEVGRSYVFGVDSGGVHIFPNYIFPSAGSYTVRLRNASTDASVTTASVTVN